MKSSEEMTKRVLLRLEQEKQRASAKRENRRKGAIRLLTTACCLSLLIGLLLLWPHRDGSGSFFAFAVSQREPSAETNAMEDAAAAPEETGEFCAEPTAPAETSEPTEASEPPEQTAPTDTAEPESWLLTAPADREHQFSLVQLTLENGKVVRHLILAGSGEPVLEDLPLAGLTPEEAFPVLLQPLVEAGYISGDPDSAPVLMLAAYDRNGYDKNGNLYEVVERDGLGAVISTALADRGITQRVLERDQTDGEYAQQLEQLYGASTEHFMPALEQVRQARKAALEENSGRVIAELFALDVTRELVASKYQIGDYDQYGELILYGPGTETPAPGWSQADIAPEIWEDYVRIYTPEDLAMLMRPRIWTTMTNVVGMDEEEAGALLRSREIVPRVIYEDNEEYRAMGFTDGQVFLQDAEPGMRWHSDASVFIWVMATEIPEQEFNGLSQGWHPEEAAQPLDGIGEPEGN